MTFVPTYLASIRWEKVGRQELRSTSYVQENDPTFIQMSGIGAFSTYMQQHRNKDVKQYPPKYLSSPVLRMVQNISRYHFLRMDFYQGSRGRGQPFLKRTKTPKRQKKH
jgi:hypothetical protein